MTAIQPQSSVPRSRLQAWGDESEKNSDKESMGDLSASSVSSLVPSVPPNQEQMMSIAQLVKYLHSLTVSCCSVPFPPPPQPGADDVHRPASQIPTQSDGKLLFGIFIIPVIVMLMPTLGSRTLSSAVISLLIVNEQEEGVVTFDLPIGPSKLCCGLELVPRCEPSTLIIVPSASSFPFTLPFPLPCYQE